MKFLVLGSVVILFLVGSLGVYLFKKPSRPNIIFIVADDVGWNDLSYHGSDQILTPNIDALAFHGLALQRHYTQQVCTPSRAALLTGQYPIRLGFQGYPLGAGMPKFIPKDVDTLPFSLKRLGYTNHLVGKWHLGYAKKEYTPLGYGYDSHFGYWNGYIGYFDHTVGFDLHGVDFHNNYQPINKSGQYATDLFTERAVQIINDHPGKDSLHLTIMHLAGHTGKINEDGEGVLEVHNETATNEKYSYIDDENRRKYAEIMEIMDTSVGTVVEALAKKDMLANSIIVFFSDNGAPTYDELTNSGSNYPLRGIKNTMYEGAVRTPSVIFSPLIAGGGNTFNGLFHVSDWMPTIFQAAGGNIGDLNAMDGINQWKSLQINEQNEYSRKELLVDIDPMFNDSAYIGFDGRYKLINNSYFAYNHTGDIGFINPMLHYESVKQSKTNTYLEKLTNNVLTLDMISFWRSKMKLDCKNQYRNPDDIKPCVGICLFDLENDPCEYNDIAADYPDIVEVLSAKLVALKQEAKPKLNYYVDKNSDPQRCNNTWFNWLDEDGCWFNITKESPGDISTDLNTNILAKLQ